MENIIPSVYKLNNGLIIGHVYTPCKDLFKIELIVRAGSMEETKEEIGFAHFIEHLMSFYPSDWWPDSIVNQQELTRRGINMNAWTSESTVGYWMEGRSEYSNLLITLLLRNFTHPEPPDKKIFKQERNAVVSELYSIINDAWYNLEQMIEYVKYKGTNLEYTVEYEKDNVKKNAKHDNIMSFRDRLYKPELTTILINSNHKNISKLVERIINIHFPECYDIIEPVIPLNYCNFLDQDCKKWKRPYKNITKFGNHNQDPLVILFNLTQENYPQENYPQENYPQENYPPFFTLPEFLPEGVPGVVPEGVPGVVPEGVPGVVPEGVPEVVPGVSGLQIFFRNVMSKMFQKPLKKKRPVFYYINPDSETDTVKIEIHFPIPFDCFDDRCYPLFLIETILSNGLGSRLYYALRTKLGAVYHVFSGSNMDPMDNKLSFFVIETETSKKKAKKVVDYILIELQRLISFKKENYINDIEWKSYSDIIEMANSMNECSTSYEKYYKFYRENLIWGKPMYTMKQVIAKRRSMNNNQTAVKKVAKQIFRPKKMQIFYSATEPVLLSKKNEQIHKEIKYKEIKSRK